MQSERRDRTPVCIKREREEREGERRGREREGGREGERGRE